ncbi:MAG: CorA family divalent cation transporter [Ilumatobacteraceae bacterium]
MIIDAAWYGASARGSTSRTPSGRSGRCSRSRAGELDGFAWLGLRMPTESELGAVQKEFDIPQLAIEDARELHDRPKVERHDSMLLTVVPTARYDDEREAVEFGELFLYCGADYLVSMRYGQAAPLSGVRSALEHDHERLARGPGAVLQAALAQVVASYEPVIDGLEGDVREVERDVFSEARAQPTRRIYFLIREVLDFLVALEPLSAAVSTLTSSRCSPWVHSELTPLFRDVEEQLAEIVGRTHNAPAPQQRAQRQPRPGLASPERRHAQDLGVGCDRRAPDRDRRAIRDEPRWYPCRRPRALVPRRQRPDACALLPAVPQLQALRLALNLVLAADFRRIRRKSASSSACGLGVEEALLGNVGGEACGGR